MTGRHRITDHASTPLLSALAQASLRQHAAFYAPGHKRGQGSWPVLKELLGARAFRADLPELPELDNLFAPAGPILGAQQLAAEAFGAEETFFLANGSTCGVEAAILAVCSPGDKVLVPRNAHQSVFSALVLSGAKPVFMAPIADADWDLAYGITPAQVSHALTQYPDISVVIVVSPNYQGVCADITGISAVVHRHSGSLIVDEAHGAHLSFHDQLPPSAMASGADIAIQSTHKVLSALTQASMLHLQGHRVDRDRLRQALQLTQSTSPNYLLLASLDAARQQMALSGHDLMAQTLAIAHEMRAQLATLPLLQILTPDHLTSLPGNFQLDLTRLAVDVSALGLSGFAADEWLHEVAHVTAELPTLRQLTFILSLGNTAADGQQLRTALAALIETVKAPEKRSVGLADTFPDWPPAPGLAAPPLSPRDVFFAKCQTMPAMAAVGHLCAETLCPYPPGIPVLLPGEPITAEVMAYLQGIQAAGGVITGAADTTLTTVRVVEGT